MLLPLESQPKVQLERKSAVKSLCVTKLATSYFQLNCMFTFFFKIFLLVSWLAFSVNSKQFYLVGKIIFLWLHRRRNVLPRNGQKYLQECVGWKSHSIRNQYEKINPKTDTSSIYHLRAWKSGKVWKRHCFKPLTYVHRVRKRSITSRCVLWKNKWNFVVVSCSKILFVK